MHNSEPEISQDAAGRGSAAARRGPAFVSDSRAGPSVAMAVLTGVALRYYLGNLFVACPRPAAAGPGDND